VDGHSVGLDALGREHPGGMRVRGGTGARRHILVDGCAHDRVGEGERSLAPDEVRSQQAVGGPRSSLDRQSGQMGDMAQLGFATQRGERLRHDQGIGSQTAQPPDDRAAHARGHELLHVLCTRAGGIERVTASGVDELAQVERVPSRCLMACLTERLVRFVSQHRPHDGPARAQAQRPQRDDDRPRALSADREFRGGSLMRSGGEQHHDVQSLQAVSEVGQPTKRRLVGPVGVVHRHEQGLTLGQVGAQPVQAVKARELVRPGARFARAGVDDRRRQHRCVLQHRRTLGSGEATDGGLEELADHSEGKVALELGATRHEHAHARARGPAASGGQEGGLSQPRGALDDHQYARTRTSTADRASEHREFCGSLEERVPAEGRQVCLHGVSRTSIKTRLWWSSLSALLDGDFSPH